MNNQQIATMTSVQERVKERIQATFLELIPTEMWEGLVKEQIKDFTEKVLPNIVRAEAEKRLRDLLAEEFKRPEWADQWGVNGNEASVMLSEVLRQAAPNLVAAMFGNMASRIVQEIRSNPHRF